MKIEIEFRGKMVSGKNQQQVAFVRGRKVIFPNKRFKAWRFDFQDQIFKQLAAKGIGMRTKDHKGGFVAAVFVDGSVQLQADYWPGDRIQRDCTGMLDALFHACEAKNGGLIVFNDAQFKIVNWHEHPLDRDNPRLLFSVQDIT